jgi:hypothetical protein
MYVHGVFYIHFILSSFRKNISLDQYLKDQCAKFNKSMMAFKLAMKFDYFSKDGKDYYGHYFMTNRSKK